MHRLLAGSELLHIPISHVIPFGEAPEAYRLVDTQPETTMGVILSYD